MRKKRDLLLSHYSRECLSSGCEGIKANKTIAAIQLDLQQECTNLLDMLEPKHPSTSLENSPPARRSRERRAPINTSSFQKESPN